MKNTLNQLETENIELRQTISKLLYTEHPANAKEDKHTNKVIELKHQVNQLANENVDLKSVVGKIRYTGPLEEDYGIKHYELSFVPPPVT